MAPAKTVNYFEEDQWSEGLRDDFDATIVDAEFREHDWNGKAQRRRDGKSGNSLVTHFTLEIDGEAKPMDQYWSWGAIEDFVPTDDGTFFQPVGAKKPYKYNPGPLLVKAFKGVKGFPKDLFAGMNIKTLIGGKFHWNLTPQEGWKPNEMSTKTQAPDILLPSAMIEEPTGKVSSGGGRGGSSSSSGKKLRTVDEEEKAEVPSTRVEPESESADEGGDELDATAIAFAKKALRAADGNTLTLEDLAGEVMVLINKDKAITAKEKKPILERVGDPKWIKAREDDGGWSYDRKKDSVSLD